MNKKDIAQKALELFEINDGAPDPKKNRSFVVDIVDPISKRVVVKSFVTASGKRLWGGIGAAKNAIRHHMESNNESNFNRMMTLFINLNASEHDEALFAIYDLGRTRELHCLNKDFCKILEDEGVIVYRELK